jgi:hypothetical protein
MDWTALVGGERISAGLKPFGSRVCLLFLSFPSFFLSLLLSPLPYSSGLPFVARFFFRLPSLRYDLSSPVPRWEYSALLMIRSDLNDTKVRHLKR